MTMQDQVVDAAMARPLRADALAYALLSDAMATSFSTDQSDAWAAQGESGWGFLSFQRGSVVFGAIFVYDQSRTPIWYSATLFNTGNLVWSGDLYETSGPFFGAAFFDQNAVTYRRVGTMTWCSIWAASAIILAGPTARF